MENPKQKLSMMAFPDLHSFAQPLYRIREQIAAVDLVLLPGDMTNHKIEDLHSVLDYIVPHNENILSICGNHDTEEIEAFLQEKGYSIHGTHKIVNGIAFLGCGGALPFVGDYVFSEEELAEILESSVKDVPKDMPKVLICHQPPYDTKLDQTYFGTGTGSKVVREFIERVQPLICFTGHIHEAVGIDKIADCQIINSGPIIGSNRYAYAEIEDGEVTILELRKANPDEN